ncbi:MAG: hypothetical protein EPN75_14290 [Beijerinckiaceae bacterium]|nr:MAG: hypothetical protein EPN75_14290 [Beijerinckiaceae bacterium]
MSFINEWWIAFVILAVGAAILFISGYLYGIVRTLSANRKGLNTVSFDSVDTRHYTAPMAIAVILSAVIIGLAGVNPAFVYIGAVLDLVTAGAIGACFFLDKS